MTYAAKRTARSYVPRPTPTGGIFDFLFGSSPGTAALVPHEGSSGTTQSKKPPLDIIKVWAGLKKSLFDNFGTYTLPSGQVATVEGRAQPLLNYGQGVDLSNWWKTVGTLLTNQAKQAGKVDAQLALTKAGLNFSYDVASWSEYAATFQPINYYKGLYMGLGPTDRLMEAIASYVVALDNALWSEYNIESDYDRWMSVLPTWMKPLFAVGWATGYVVDKLPEWGSAAFKDIRDAASLTGKLLKWSLYIGLGAFALWAFSKARK